MLRLVLFFCLAVLASCDLPVDCSYAESLGTWVYQETDRTGDRSIDCSEIGDVTYTKQFTLEYPDLVTDELGHTGTWTLIYNQGFEVRINERSYWAPFYYSMTDEVYSCDRLYNGWSRDSTVRNWACVTAYKDGVDEITYHPFSDIGIEESEEKFTNDEAFIKKINSAQSSWTAKAYPEFEVYTMKEMRLRAGGKPQSMPHPRPASEEEKARASLLPESFDWTDVNGVSYVSPVRDQGACGSCYAFASAGLLESRLRIATRNARQDVFSTQDVVSCTNLAEGCSGGFSFLIGGRYAMDQGMAAEICSPYVGAGGDCTTDQTCSRTYSAGYQYVGGYYGASNEENMMEALVSGGPLAVAFMVHDDFYNYGGGIYVHSLETRSDFDPFYATSHAVLLVGYGVDEVSGEKFWKVKNSWSSEWGEDGFFRIRRGTNEVGIESTAFESTVIP